MTNIDGLTREQVLNEPVGERLNRWVAEYVMCYEPGTVTLGGWNPSADISTGFEVVEKMQETHWFALENGLSIGSWRCAFGKYGAPQSPVVFADTAPLAICRAALLAVMEG